MLDSTPHPLVPLLRSFTFSRYYLFISDNCMAEPGFCVFPPASLQFQPCTFLLIRFSLRPSATSSQSLDAILKVSGFMCFSGFQLSFSSRLLTLPPSWCTRGLCHLGFDNSFSLYHTVTSQRDVKTSYVHTTRVHASIYMLTFPSTHTNFLHLLTDMYPHIHVDSHNHQHARAQTSPASCVHQQAHGPPYARAGTHTDT